MIGKRRFRAGNGTELPYLLYAPEERGDGPLPMIFYLHGAGSRGKDLSQLRRNGLSGMILGGEFHVRCIVAAPQCPEEGVWLHYIRELGELADFSAAESGADPDRIALTGMSMGGFGAWELAAYRPERFSCLAALCGGGMSWQASRLANLPIRAFHGGKDDVVPPVYSRLMVDAVNACGGNAVLTIYPENGHNCWDDAYRHSDVIPWMLAQKRAAPPEPVEFTGENP